MYRRGLWGTWKEPGAGVKGSVCLDAAGCVSEEGESLGALLAVLSLPLGHGNQRGHDVRIFRRVCGLDRAEFLFVETVNWLILRSPRGSIDVVAPKGPFV